jgi:hypothetical protein
LQLMLGLLAIKMYQNVLLVLLKKVFFVVAAN